MSISKTENTQPRLGDRTLFPSLRASAYLSHAAVSPASSVVVSAVQETLLDYSERGVIAVPHWWDHKQTVRQQLAQLIGAQASDIGFVANTTSGVTTIAMCFPWQQGDRIVVFDGEFPANVTPWLQAAKQHGLEVTVLARPEPSAVCDAIQRLEDALKHGVRLVAVSAVQFQTGLRLPLDEISQLCCQYGAQLFVDAIQACGVVPIDVHSVPIDYLSCGSHKWLMGLEGCAFLYVRPERVGALKPVVAGWLSHEDPLDFLFSGPGRLRYDKSIRSEASFVEAGAANVLGIVALGASVGLIQTLGVDAIFAHVTDYLNHLEPELVSRGWESLRAPQANHRSAILSVRSRSGVEVSAVAKSLGERGIVCTYPEGFLRFAPHWSNSLNEVEHVLVALDELHGSSD